MTAAMTTAVAPPKTAGTLALAVADANWFTTENLFCELKREGVSTLLIKAVDYVNAWRRDERPWSWGRPLSKRGAGLWERGLVLPTGWMKRYPRLGMRPIQRAIASWRQTEARSERLALVMTYPHYLYLRDLVRPDISVYFNLDDYTLYWPGWEKTIYDLERRAVAESDVTVCVSHSRCEALRQELPAASHKIRHFPHGAPSPSVEPTPCHVPAVAPDDIAHLPRPLLGYVGSLEDRIDWELLDKVALSFPSASLVLLGRVPQAGQGAWWDECRRVLSRPNVHALGWRPQGSIASYNRAFDVCLIPYDVTHPFNAACCPTKIMDSMGSGRPIVSTDLPECRLYSHLFDVASNADGFILAVREIVAHGSDDGRAQARHATALDNNCTKMAGRLLDWLRA
jgi:glycosyltransferase involved in cell wall biosynthesis